MSVNASDNNIISETLFSFDRKRWLLAITFLQSPLQQASCASSDDGIGIWGTFVAVSASYASSLIL